MSSLTEIKIQFQGTEEGKKALCDWMFPPSRENMLGHENVYQRYETLSFSSEFL